MVEILTDSVVVAPVVAPVAPVAPTALQLLALYAGDANKLRQASRSDKQAALALATNLIFGVFGAADDKGKHGKTDMASGTLIGKAITNVLTGVYGKKGVNVETITADQIGTTFSMQSITVRGEKGTGIAFAQAALAKLVSDKRTAIADRAVEQANAIHAENGKTVRTFTDTEIAEQTQAALDGLESAALSAGEWLSEVLPIIPSASKVYAAINRGKVNIGGKSELAFNEALAMVLMNVPLKAVAVCDRARR